MLGQLAFSLIGAIITLALIAGITFVGVHTIQTMDFLSAYITEPGSIVGLILITAAVFWLAVFKLK